MRARPGAVRLYLRLSRATEESTAIQRQRDEGQEVAETRWPGVPVVEYVDEGVSGGLAADQRPDLARLMKEWETGDVLIFWKVDRLARSMVHFVRVMEAAQNAGVVLVSVRDAFDLSTAEGRFQANILATFAEFEREQIRARVRNSRKHLQKVGRWTGGRLPYGLRAANIPQSPGKRLERDPVAADIIRRIVDDVMAGKAITAVARQLQAEGVPSPRVHTSTRPNPRPAAWSSRSIQIILESPTIVGHQTDPVTGRVMRGPDGLPLAVWEPVISPERRAEVLERVGPSSRRAKAGDRHPLYGVAVCGICAGNMKRTNGGNFQPGLVTFRCRGPLRAPHGNVSVRADQLTAWTWEAIVGRLGAMEGVRREYVQGSDHGDDAERLREYLAELEDDRRAGMYATTEALARFRASYADTSQRIAELEAQPATETGWRLVPTGESFVDEWAAMTDQARGDYLRRIGATVSVMPPDIPRHRVPLAERVSLDLGELEDVAWELEAVAADID
ncbi:MAG: recombinase family protein [Zwartia sp.]